MDELEAKGPKQVVTSGQEGSQRGLAKVWLLLGRGATVGAGSDRVASVKYLGGLYPQNN